LTNEWPALHYRIKRDTPLNLSSINHRASILRSALFSDSLSYFGSKVVPGFMGLISVPVFIRVIGLDQYGRFAVIVPFLMAVAGASSGWLAQGILRFHPGATVPQDCLLTFDRAVKRATIASVIVTSVVLAAVLDRLQYPFPTLLVSLAFCLALLVYTVGLSKFQAQLWPRSVLRREIVRSAGGFVFPLVLIALTGRRQFELVVYDRVSPPLSPAKLR
jgi:O-antigen/teichoic acid export membrane protein